MLLWMGKLKGSSLISSFFKTFLSSNLPLRQNHIHQLSEGGREGGREGEGEKESIVKINTMLSIKTLLTSCMYM